MNVLIIKCLLTLLKDSMSHWTNSLLSSHPGPKPLHHQYPGSRVMEETSCLNSQDSFLFLTHIVNVHSQLHCMILEFVHSASLTSEKFPCFPWPPWNSARLFLHLRWQQQCGLHGKTAVCNFPKSTWETEVIIWMNLEWWGLHALRHVYLRSVCHASHCDRWCPALNESGQIRERSVPSSSEWCLSSACQSWSWAWYRSCWLWELHSFVYKVAWWRTGLESGALGGARSAAASARPIHLLATPVMAKQTEWTSPPYSQEPPGSKRSPKQRHW